MQVVPDDQYPSLAYLESIAGATPVFLNRSGPTCDLANDKQLDCSRLDTDQIVKVISHILKLAQRLRSTVKPATAYRTLAPAPPRPEPASNDNDRPEEMECDWELDFDENFNVESFIANISNLDVEQGRQEERNKENPKTSHRHPGVDLTDDLYPYY